MWTLPDSSYKRKAELTQWALYINQYSELVFLNVYGAQESIPRNEFRQPM